jgi:hypothetical protein
MGTRRSRSAASVTGRGGMMENGKWKMENGNRCHHWCAFTFAIFLLPFSMFTSGCGYNQSGNEPKQKSDYKWRSLYRQDIHTVAVPIFTNKDFRRGLEFRLSKAVVNQLEVQTPYKVVSRENADTILEGEITEIRVNTISNDYDLAIPQEQLMTVVINFVWKDLRSGQILVERRDFEQTAPYYPTLGEGEFVGTQQSAEQLAIGIVQELQADW